MEHQLQQDDRIGGIDLPDDIPDFIIRFTAAATAASLMFRLYCDNACSYLFCSMLISNDLMIKGLIYFMTFGDLRMNYII